MTFNQRVLGSNPKRATILINRVPDGTFFLENITILCNNINEVKEMAKEEIKNYDNQFKKLNMSMYIIMGLLLLLHLLILRKITLIKMTMSRIYLIWRWIVMLLCNIK